MTGAVLVQQAQCRLWKLSVLEKLPNGEMGFVVKFTSIPTKRDAEIIANMAFRNGLIARFSKHINPKKEYFYGK
jgi:hypothetical protein